MSPQLPDRSPDEHRTPVNLAGRVATATSRLILIAIVVGGLLTVALNLRHTGPSDFAGPLNQPAVVAPGDALVQHKLPLSQWVVAGDEAAARNAVIRNGRERIGDHIRTLGTSPVDGASGLEEGNPFADAVELARDGDGTWSIVQSQDLPRRVLGLSLAGGEPTVVFWGGYDETGPGEWTTWTMLLPRPEK